MTSSTKLELGNSVRAHRAEMHSPVPPKMMKYVRYHDENSAMSDMPIIFMPSRTCESNSNGRRWVSPALTAEPP